MRWFMNLSMQTKLVSAFLVMVALLAVVGVAGLRGMRAANKSLDTLYHNEMAGVSAAQDVRSLVLDTGRLYRQVLLDSGAGASRDNVAKIEANLVAIDGNIESLGRLHLHESETKLIEEIRSTLPDWKERVAATTSAAINGDIVAARASAASNGANASKLVKALASVTAGLDEAANAATKEADRQDAMNLRLVLALLVVGIVLGVGMALTIARLVSKPLRAAVAVLDSVASGDFTKRLQNDTRDEIGQLAASLNLAIEGMSTSLTEVRHSAESVNTASRELSSSSSNISEGAQEQASSLEETAAALEQLTSTVQQNADNSQQAAQIARGAREVAERGGSIVSEAVLAMRAINTSSKHISEIITTIDEIAFQTNLLALNAAVEAARAGEQGRGFAVVAGEVRNLAQRSSMAAKEIKGLIQDSVDKVEAGTDLVNRSGEALQEIMAGVSRVTDIVGEIAAASREQATGIGEVGTAITQMDHVTQANAAQTEELAGTAESLSSQAQQLQAMVARYQLGKDLTRSTMSTPFVPGTRSSHLEHAGPKPVDGGVKRQAAQPTASATATDGFEAF